MMRGDHPIHLVTGLTLWVRMVPRYLCHAFRGLCSGATTGGDRRSHLDQRRDRADDRRDGASAGNPCSEVLAGAPQAEEGPRPSRFLARVSAAAYLVAAIAALVVGLPTMALPPCT